MSRDPLVSAIIIFLNEERFLEEAIGSVFAQTYGNWELLLVDDGSTDRSTEIARQYAQRSPGKVRYLDHEGHQNRGMSASRNLGIAHAKGEYVAFLDADDIWMSHKLEQQVAIMASHPDAGLVCGRAQWWYGWTGNQGDSQRDFVQKLDVPLDTLVQPPTLLTLFLRDEWASLCDILIKREAVEAVGAYEESFRGCTRTRHSMPSCFCASLRLCLPLAGTGIGSTQRLALRSRTKLEQPTPRDRLS